MKLRVSGEQNVYCDIHRYLSGSRLLDTSGHVKVTDLLSVKNYKLSRCHLLNLDIFGNQHFSVTFWQTFV